MLSFSRKNILSRYQNLLLLFFLAGKIHHGKVQQAVYLLKKTGFPGFNEDFTYQYPNAYSEQLAFKLEEMVSFGLLEREEKTVSGRKRCFYSLTGKGKQCAKKSDTLRNLSNLQKNSFSIPRKH